MNISMIGKMSALLSRFGNLKDVLTLAVPKGFGLLASVASSILIVRGLSIAEVGAYTLVVGYYSSVALLSDLGVNLTIYRYASRAAAMNEKLFYAVLRWGFRLKLGTAILATLGLFAVAPLIADSWKISELLGLIRFSLMIGFWGCFSVIPIIYYQAKQEFRASGRLQFIQSVIGFLPICVLYLISNWTIESVVMATALGSALTLAVGFTKMPLLSWWNKKEIVWAFRAPKRFWLHPAEADALKTETDTLSPMQYLLYVIPAVAAYAALMRVDVLVLGIFLSQTEIALYGVAQRIATPLATLVEAAENTLLPSASNVFGVEETKNFLSSALKTTGIIAIALGGYALIAPQFIPILFGEAYRNAIELTTLLCVRFVFTVIAAPFVWLAYNFNFATSKWMFRAVQFLLMLSVSLMLIPIVGVFAPATAWNISEFFWLSGVCVFLLIQLRKSSGKR